MLIFIFCLYSSLYIKDSGMLLKVCKQLFEVSSRYTQVSDCLCMIHIFHSFFRNIITFLQHNNQRTDLWPAYFILLIPKPLISLCFRSVGSCRSSVCRETSEVTFAAERFKSMRQWARFLLQSCNILLDFVSFSNLRRGELFSLINL